MEAFIIGTNGRIVAVNGSAGVTVTSSSVSAANVFAASGINLVADVFAANIWFASGASVNGEWWQVTFPPQNIAKVIFCNRADALNVNQRIALGNGVLSVIAGNTSVIASQNLTSALVQTLDLAPVPTQPTPAPDAVGQTEALSRSTKARYVRLSALPGSPLACREIWLLDNNNGNIALGRSATAVNSSGAVIASVTSVTNGVIEFDNNATDSDGILLPAGPQSPSITVDLGGLYSNDDIGSGNIIVWNNRYRLPAAGTRLELLNWFMEPIFNVTLTTTAGVQTVPIRNATYYPSQTPTNTPSPSNTPSNTASPSQTRTGTPSSSTTASNTGTATSSITASQTATTSATSTLSIGASPSVTSSPMSIHPVSVRITEVRF